MKKILMYSDSMCNFVKSTKKLLNRNNAKLDVKDISKGNIRDEMIKSNGRGLYHKYFLMIIMLKLNMLS